MAAANDDKRHSDMLNLSSNVQCQKMLSKMGDNFPEQEKVVMSVMLVKINKLGKEQNRILLLTDKALYNLKPKEIRKCQRRIDLKNVVSVTISRTSQEFAIHIPKEHDYRYISVYKERIASVLAVHYKRKEGKELVINEIQQDSMLQVTLTKDAARLQKREPRHFSGPAFKCLRRCQEQLIDYREKARLCSDVKSTRSTDEIGPQSTMGCTAMSTFDASAPPFVWMDAERMAERMDAEHTEMKEEQWEQWEMEAEMEAEQWEMKAEMKKRKAPEMSEREAHRHRPRHRHTPPRLSDLSGKAADCV